MADKDKKEAKWTLQDILGACAFGYIIIFVLCFFAFTSLEDGLEDGDPMARGFLKAAIWPYSVVEWNIEN